jgi:hypothetical protein
MPPGANANNIKMTIMRLIKPCAWVFKLETNRQPPLFGKSSVPALLKGSLMQQTMPAQALG